MVSRSHASCRACGMEEFHRLLEIASRFPQLAQDRRRCFFSLGLGSTNPFGLHGEYPIEVWHGVDQCPSLSAEMILTELNTCSAWAQ